VSPRRLFATFALALATFTCRTSQVSTGSAACSSGSSATACHSSVDESHGAALGLLQFSSDRATPRAAKAGVGEEGNRSADVNPAWSRTELRGLLGVLAEAATDVSCAMYPALCEEPFNCRQKPPTPLEVAYWSTAHVATEDGHSNLRTWCMEPDFYGTVTTLCLKNHDLKANAHRLYYDQVMKGIGQADGSYCFLEGHCSNMDVTYDTTLEEAEALCDAKYGHENWTSVTFTSILRDPIGLKESVTTGFRSRELSAQFGMLACAMGNFHCDVIYCRDTYCKKPEYVEKYGHYLKDFGYIS